MHTNVLILTVCLSAVGAVGCNATDVLPEAPAPAEERGPLGKADQAGSCEGHCGGKSAGHCWCDDWCEYYGDCCADKFPVCDEAGGQSTGTESESGSSSDGDGTVAPTAVTQLAAGGQHTCALLDNGAVRCWGDNAFGQLGYGHTDAVGDDELPADAGDVELGGVATQIATARRHSCALLDTGAVRCWGSGTAGRLGYGDTDSIGDDESPAVAGEVDVGEPVVRIAVGGENTCAITTSGALRCWGSTTYDGVPGTAGAGLDQPPSAAPAVDIGGAVDSVTMGDRHTCARLVTGTVRCFGTGLQGQHGQGVLGTIGDDEHPSQHGDVPLRYYQDVEQVSAGLNHTCVRYDSDTLHCWGVNWDRQCGYRSPELIQNPQHVSAVNLDDNTPLVAAGGYHSCAILDSGAVKCWGANADGQLGAGHAQSSTGDPSAEAPVALLGVPIALSAGFSHTCALLEDGAVQCWGRGVEGQLGLGTTENIGDDEAADAGGTVEVF
ncbi:MAG: hypothetical protein AAF721_29450 [Myxococcota bacterium]